MREKLLMNRGWLFYEGEPDYIRTDTSMSDQSYRGSRAMNARGPARKDFDDSGWKTVSLPHDFVALHGVSETDPHGGEHFDFPFDRGSAWYRRYFTLPKEDFGKRIALHFEGMGTFCSVYVNSMLVRTHRTNGIGFEVDITDLVTFDGAQNVVAVHCDCHDYETWYYEGGGITRNVWLVKTDRLFVDLWGTFARSERVDEKSWKIRIDTEVRNQYEKETCAAVISRIAEEGTKKEPEILLAAESEPQAVPVRETVVFRQEVMIENPKLWSPKAPNLYRLLTEVVKDGETVDTYETIFGIRELVYDKDQGLLLNGEKTTIYGFANHMTYLGVGEAMTDSMCEYQIRTLRDMGSNGYRTAHSPHQEAIMNWCDRYGQLVMDENRVFHSTEIGIDEVRRLIKRDRNHPSVCMWSLFNEEDLVTEETGRRIFRTLKEEVLKLDDTRPVTGATSYGMFSEGMHGDHDIFGFNHQTMNFDALHHLHADKPIYCSEMIFPVGPERPGNQEMGVRTGEDARQLLKPWTIGGFHFTAWAYGPECPSFIGMEGTLGARYYGFRALLRPEEPFAKIVPGWDFPGKEGQEVQLLLANNGDRVEILVNGKETASVETDLYAITPVSLVYEPGEVQIKVYKNGALWAEDQAVTPGKPVKIELVCENGVLHADGSDAAIVSAYLVDAEGNRCLSVIGPEVRFSWNDAAELVTTLSIRDDHFQGYQGERIRVFDGKCQALFRALPGEKEIVVCAESEGLQGAELHIPCPEAAVSLLPEEKVSYVTGWQMSPRFPEGVSDKEIISRHLTRRWRKVDTLGTPALYEGHEWNIPEGSPVNYAYYTKCVIPPLPKKDGEILALRFIGIDGKASVYICGKNKAAGGEHGGDSPWFGHYRPEMILPASAFEPGDEVEIWVMMHDVGRVNGIGWPVHWLYTTEEAIRALNEKTAREWEYHKYRDEA